MYCYSKIVNLLGSSPGTALHFQVKVSARSNLMKQVMSYKSLEACRNKLKWHGCISKCVLNNTNVSNLILLTNVFSADL